MNSMKYLKRLLCIILSLFCFGANISIAFANEIYDSSTQSIDDFYNLKDDYPLIKIQVSGDGNILVGNDINPDSTLTLDTTKYLNFSVVTNTDVKKWSMLNAILIENGDAYISPLYNNKDGTTYYLDIVKEEINFENMKFVNNYEMEGKFNFNGEYLAQEIDGSSSKQLKVTINGTVKSYDFMKGEDNKLFLYLDLKAENNQGVFEINEESQLKTITSYWNNDEFIDDQYTLDVEFYILNAEFGNVQNEVEPIPNTTEPEPSNTDLKDIDQSNTDSNDILNEEVTALNEKEEINKEPEDTFKTESPGKVAAAVVVSIALATTGSAALTSASGSAMNNFVQLEEQNDEIQKQSGNGEEENKNIENNTEYSFIINSGEPLPELCNSKGAVINIPIYIENGEDLIWNFNFIPICQNGLYAAAGAVINPDVNNSTNLSLSITGKQFVENSLQIFCNIEAYTSIDDNKVQIRDAFELTIYNIGLQANIKDPSKKISKDSLNVNYVRESKIKGIAEVIKLEIYEFNTEIVEENEEQFKLVISAENKEYGSCDLIVKK